AVFAPQLFAVLFNVAATTFGAVVFGAVAANLVSQGLSMAFGIQKSFNWSSLAISAISAGITYGLGQIPIPAGVTIPPMVTAVARAALSNALTQGIAVAVGWQKKLDWKGVAAAGASAGVSFAITESIGMAQWGADSNKEGMDLWD